MKRLLILPVCFFLSACVYNQHSHDRLSGTDVSKQQVQQIESGKTTKEWVLTHLGIPDRTQVDKDGLEVFEYVSERNKKSEKTFIFLFNIESETVLSHKVTRILMRNGIVESVVASDV